ncbi:hypothetical protein EFA01_02240 [Enterococcus faecalis]|nr:hypothetical protein JARBHU0796_08320 [Enterococcus faecalis]BDX44527.1 hypothetical protein L6D_18430 [Enterococcus faecalis]BDX50914.1 hypothetical protein N4E_24170 [Enterococcus faecalis]GEA99910.1 hypothetical protein EFA01_02240 [Enterococcus faecalis]GEJ64378.1 hypothetical protein EfaecalisJ2_20240 [Enterococcus faecalis]
MISLSTNTTSISACASMDFPQLAKANRDHPKITNLFKRTAKIYTLKQVSAILTNAFCSS